MLVIFALFFSVILFIIIQNGMEEAKNFPLSLNMNGISIRSQDFGRDCAQKDKEKLLTFFIWCYICFSWQHNPEHTKKKINGERKRRQEKQKLHLDNMFHFMKNKKFLPFIIYPTFLGFSLVFHNPFYIMARELAWNKQNFNKVSRLFIQSYFRKIF